MADVPLEVFSQLVEAIYDCALDPNRWQDTIATIAELTASQRCVLGVHDLADDRSELAVNLGYESEDYWRLHEEKYKGLNPLFAPIMLLPVGAVSTRAMLMADSEFLETKFYQEWCKPQGLGDAINVKVLQTGMRMGLLVGNRLEANPRYGDAEFRLFTLMSPHVCRAVAISDALNLKTIRSAALEATLDALASGVYLTDRLGRVVFMNRAAERQIKAGVALRIEHEHLAPVDRVAQAAMSKAIAEAIADEASTPASGFTLALPAAEGSGLVATILPLTRGERRNICGAFSAWVAVFVQDPVVVPTFPGEAFAKLHGLTGGELRVCSLPWHPASASRRRPRCSASARPRPRPTCSGSSPRPAPPSRPSSSTSS